jgi:drug/metabolite transporter (DMT)-like permease
MFIAIALLIVYVVWGSTYLAIRIMVDEMPPLLGAGTRFLVAGLLVGAELPAQTRRPARPTSTNPAR